MCASTSSARFRSFDIGRSWYLWWQCPASFSASTLDTRFITRMLNIPMMMVVMKKKLEKNGKRLITLQTGAFIHRPAKDTNTICRWTAFYFCDFCQLSLVFFYTKSVLNILFSLCDFLMKQSLKSPDFENYSTFFSDKIVGIRCKLNSSRAISILCFHQCHLFGQGPPRFYERHSATIVRSDASQRHIKKERGSEVRIGS